MKIYLGLVHHPVTNKRGEIVTTSVTNLDIHDIARSCKTYGVCKYHIITPLEAQHDLVSRILGHWESDKANSYNPDRSNALRDIFLSKSFEESYDLIAEQEGINPIIAVTGANFSSGIEVSQEILQYFKIDEQPLFLLFGTGWGLHASIVEKADIKLAPLKGRQTDYNHLSVRSAVAIYLDRFACAGL